MKHSTDTAANRARLEPQVSLIAAPPLRRLLPLVAVDLGARLAAPFTLIVLASGPSRAALVGATGVTLFAAARAGLSGWAYDAASREAWTSVVSAARNHDVATLRNRPDAHGVASLTDAVAQIVQLRANDVPRGIADALALASTLLAVVVVLGWSWLLVGGLALGAASVVVIVAQRRMRTAQREAFERFSEATHDFEVLTEAAAELRAHGCEERHANDLLGKAAAMAAAQRRTATASAMLGLFPMGVTLLVASLPLGLGALLPSSPAGEVVRAGVLGMAALAFGLGVVRAAEAWGRSAAHRESLAGFLSTARRLET
ncbi:MAG TPA: hypothetical protein ENK57_00445, partial [Polyangiaceae bacterium]|nr:hypothetical protein [Polyangiaceae bacterium]